MADKKILVSLTTGENVDQKIKDITRLKIREIALFLSCLDYNKRKKLYKRLLKTEVTSIPHVHARTDMRKSEYLWLVKNFKTKAFNLHPFADFPRYYEYGSLKKKIYLENVMIMPTPEELDEYGGLCIDFSHLENDRRRRKNKYKTIIEYAGKYKIGCCHVSAITEKLFLDDVGLRHDIHTYDKLNQFDYLKRYKGLLPKYISIELENSIEEQQAVKEYIKKFL